MLSLLNGDATSALGLVDRLVGELRAHIEGADQFDDITLLAVRWLSPVAPENDALPSDRADQFREKQSKNRNVPDGAIHVFSSCCDRLDRLIKKKRVRLSTRTASARIQLQLLLTRLDRYQNPISPWPPFGNDSGRVDRDAALPLRPDSRLRPMSLDRTGATRMGVRLAVTSGRIGRNRPATQRALPHPRCAISRGKRNRSLPPPETTHAEALLDLLPSSPPSTTSPAAKNAKPRRWNFELLEDRVTPAVSTTLSAGILTVNLSAASDTAFITNTSTGINVGITASASGILSERSPASRRSSFRTAARPWRPSRSASTVRSPTP